MLNSLVQAPAVRAPLHSLLASGNVVESSNAVTDTTDGTSTGQGAEWENGVTFTPRGCYEILGTCATCDFDAENEAPQECHPAVVFKPYLLDLGLVYPTADRFDIKGLVTDGMEVGTSSRLERLIWEGCDGDDNPLLSEGGGLGSTLPPKAALGAVMAELVSSTGHTGARGTIHMSPRVSVELEGLLKEDDGVLRTLAGKHKVILGDYPDTHIAAHVGEVDIYLGGIYVTDAPDEVRRANVQTFQVQRLAVAAWNTCAAFLQPVTL
jgi:hypothetical protein